MRCIVPCVLALLVSGCVGAGSEDESYDPFTAGGASDQATSYILVPEGAAFEIEPNTELLEERIWYEPYTVDQDGNDIHIYRTDDAWYQIRRYAMNIDGPGDLRVSAVSLTNLLIDLWRVTEEGNERVEFGTNHLEYTVTEPGRYGILVEASMYPVITEAEEAYIDYILQTAFEPN